MQLDNISKQITELIVGQPANKSKFRKHIEKVIRETERHRQYLLEQCRKAKEAGWVFYDESKDRDEWTWSLNAYSDICKHTYFTEDERFCKKEIPSVQFYIEGKPEPDPLTYLCSMLWGCVGQVYEGLELLDYQFALMAIIHDAQSWQAGQESIYFNILGKETLSDRLCGAVWCHLSERLQSQYGFPKDVQRTIETALANVKANLASGDKADLRNEKPAETLKVWLSIVVLVIAVLGFFGINKYTDFFNRKPSSSPTIQPDTPPVIKSPIDPNIVDINKPISKPPRG